MVRVGKKQTKRVPVLVQMTHYLHYKKQRKKAKCKLLLEITKRGLNFWQKEAGKKSEQYTKNPQTFADTEGSKANTTAG